PWDGHKCLLDEPPRVAPPSRELASRSELVNQCLSTTTSGQTDDQKNAEERARDALSKERGRPRANSGCPRASSATCPRHERTIGRLERCVEVGASCWWTLRSFRCAQT